MLVILSKRLGLFWCLTHWALPSRSVAWTDWSSELRWCRGYCCENSWQQSCSIGSYPHTVENLQRLVQVCVCVLTTKLLFFVENSLTLCIPNEADPQSCVHLQEDHPPLPPLPPCWTHHQHHQPVVQYWGCILRSHQLRIKSYLKAWLQ